MNHTTKHERLLNSTNAILIFRRSQYFRSFVLEGKGESCIRNFSAEKKNPSFY